MKLVTIQTFCAFQNLIHNGFLEADEQYIHLEKSGIVYQWVQEKMNQVLPNSSKYSYPLWAWVQYGQISSPPKHKLLGYFKEGEDLIVRITFRKPERELLFTDFEKFSFVISNQYLPCSKQDYEWFQSFQKERQVSNEDLKAYVRRDRFKTCRTDADFLEVNQKVRESFDRALECASDQIQACFWRLSIEEIEKIELIRRDTCVPKNYKRIDLKKKYLKHLFESNSSE